MIKVDEVIQIMIEYKGIRQGLFTDYGGVFDQYLAEFEQDLRRCSLFETQDREDALAIRYRNNEFVIYHTDERAALWGVEYKFIHSKDAAQKFLELFHLGQGKI